MPSPASPPESKAPESKAPEQLGEIDPRLLEVLVCPLTHTALDYDRAAGELISRAARLAYPIRSGVPVMLPEEARALDAPEA
jgi:uncharacterized protein YbaR (Trm112 family)